MIQAENVFTLPTKESTHAKIGALLYGLRDTVDQLIAIRVRNHGRLLDGEYDELTEIKTNLDFLLSDIKESTSN